MNTSNPRENASNVPDQPLQRKAWRQNPMPAASEVHGRDDPEGRDNRRALPADAGQAMRESPGRFSPAVQAQGQGLKPAQQQPGILRPEDCSGSILEKADFFSKLRLRREHAGDYIVMAAQILGAAVNGMSAPRSSGRWQQNVRKVLSTMSSAPCVRQAWQWPGCRPRSAGVAGHFH